MGALGWALVGAGVMAGLVVGIRDTRSVAYDDAAIMMRYAYRIAAGRGFTYNNGDPTNGASAPLYTLLLAMCRYLGVDLVVAVKVIALISYAAVFGIATLIAQRLAGTLAGVLVIVFLALAGDFRLQALSGMESGLAAALGLSAIALVVEEKEIAGGVMLGLAVFNKLDAGLLVAGVASGMVVAFWWVPWRLLMATVAAFAPWALFSQVYFGSIIPHSATEKLNHESKGVVLDHAWLLKAIRADRSAPLLITAALTLAGVAWLMKAGRRAQAAGLAACIFWAALHVVAYSYLNFGGTYPWYKTLAYPPIMIAAAVGIGIIASATGGSSAARLVGPVAAVGIALGLVADKAPQFHQDAQVLLHGHQVSSYEAFEATRRQAGVYLGRVAAPGDVVETCFGWIAYGAEQTTVKETCPLSTRKPVGRPRWFVDVSFAGIRSQAPAGFELVERFRSHNPQGDGSTEVYRSDLP